MLYAGSRSGADLGTESISSAVKLKYEKLSLTDLINTEHGGCDDVLINNAGLFYYDENIKSTRRRKTLDVNYRAHSR